MSRVGKLPVKVPSKIKLKIENRKLEFDNGNLSEIYTLRPNVEIEYSDNIIKLSAKDGNKRFSVDVGMDRSNINNIVEGLSNGFEIKLEINGVGYKAEVIKKTLILSLGFSHEIFYSLPQNISAVFEKPNLIILKGFNKILIGQVASEIISFRKPEPYKGKGIKILGSKILRKEGKKK